MLKEDVPAQLSAFMIIRQLRISSAMHVILLVELVLVPEVMTVLPVHLARS